MIARFTDSVDFDAGPNTDFYYVSAYSVALFKYDANGNYLLTKKLVGQLHINDYPNTLEVDNSGNIYIVGYFEGIIDFNPGNSVNTYVTCSGFTNSFFAKYDTDGNYIWAKRKVIRLTIIAVQLL